MTQRLVSAATYLSYAEAVELYQLFQTEEISALVKSCGPPSLPFGEGIYFQLFIQEADTIQAKPVLDLFFEKQAKNSSASPTCPQCASVYVAAAPKLTWWQKLKYAGTSVFACQTCRKTFFL